MRLYEVFKRPKGGVPHQDKYLGVFACHNEREAGAEAANWEFGADLDEANAYEMIVALWDGRRPPHGGPADLVA